MNRFEWWSGMTDDVTYLGINGRIGEVGSFSEILKIRVDTGTCRTIFRKESLPVCDKTLKKDDFPTLGSPMG